MPQTRYNTLVPLGALEVTAAGATVLLSANCGPLAGQSGPITDYNNPPLPGQPLRQIILTATGGAAVLLPRGMTAAANAAQILAYLPENVPVSIPYGTPFENGFLPENFCLDVLGDATDVIVYGCGVLS